MSEIMNSNDSIDIAYGLIERAERQRRRLALIAASAFIPAILGLVVDSYLFVLFSHQKSPLDGKNTFFVLILFIICLFLITVAVHRLLLLRKYNKKINEIAVLEEAIYSEVLKGSSDVLGKIDP